MSGVDPSIGGADRADGAEAAEGAASAREGGEAGAADAPHDHEEARRNRPLMMASGGIAGLVRSILVDDAASEAAEAGEAVHEVRPGDTLYRIAQSNGTTVDALLRLNPEITDPNAITVGQQVRLPGGDGAERAGGAAPPAGSVEARVLGFEAEIRQASERHGVPPAMIAAIIERESSGDPNALSFDGGHGKGLMQIDDRFHELARTDAVFDPATNVDYGASLLAESMRAFPGDERAAIAAFNAGIGGVQRAIASTGDPASATYHPSYTADVLEAMERYRQHL